MAIKKSELYASIWASCDELRGGMDASQFFPLQCHCTHGREVKKIQKGERPRGQVL